MMKTNTRLILATAMMVMLFAVGWVSAIAPPPVPTVNFTANDVSGPYPFTVTFTATTTGMTPPLSYEWDFGDNSGAERLSGTSITHTYQNPGKYTVRVAANDLGIPITIWVSNTKADYITVTHIKPVAGFTYTFLDGNSVGNSPLTVQFNSTTTGFEPELLWDFGDGSTTTDPNPKHTFVSKGHPGLLSPYEVNLTATNDGGSNTHTATIVVAPAVPIADFIATSTTVGSVPLAVQFSDISDSPALIIARSWDFGDGTAKLLTTSRTPIHAYASIGVYNVTLEVQSAYGKDSKTRERYINVTAVTGPVICPPIQPPTPDKSNIGIYKDGLWYLDVNGNSIWDAGIDKAYSFGQSGWSPVKGDWNSDGVQEVGVYKDGVWYLDTDGSGTWNAGDKLYTFGSPGFTPIVGDWTGSGTTRIGVYKAGSWYLDLNNNGIWDGGSVDRQSFGFGTTGWDAVPGKWS